MAAKDLSLIVRDFSKPLHLVLRPYQLVSDVLIFLQISRIKEKIFYFYVADEDDRLVGVVSARKLLFSPAHDSISSIMDTSVVALREEDSLEVALELFASHHLLCVPVVDNNKVLQGSVDVQTTLGESIDYASAQRKIDVFQMVGLHLEEGRRKSTGKCYLTRMPWLFCNLFGGFACAMISDFFELVIAKYLVLAMFLPLVLSLSESVTMQTVMQSLLSLKKTGHAPLKKYFKIFAKEMKVVFLVALTCAVIVACMSPLWGEGIITSAVMGLGIFLSINISSMFGVFLPIFLNKSTLDPKIASGPVVLMIADIGTTLIYLSLATFWLL